MSPKRRRPRASGIVAAILLAWAYALPAVAQRGATSAVLPTVERLVLAATLDGVPVAEPVLVRRQGGAIRMRAADLRAMGIAVPGAEGELPLADVPGLTAVIDDRAQAIALTRSSTVQQVRIDGGRPTDAAVAVTRSVWGGIVNYDTAVTRVRRTAVAGALVDAVVYGPAGLFQAGAVLSSRSDRGQRHVQRLDTGFTTGDAATARRLTIGDTIAGATEQSRPVRLGGVQIANDSDLRPDLVTFPVPDIAGSAAVPSAVDLIVNGSRQAAGSVRAGKFAVTDLPVQTGVNTITVAVRDALGRETRQTVSTYVSRALLRRGLSAWSAEAGWVRTGYATAADRYADFVASGSGRTGVSDRLTMEGHVEIGGRVGVGTVGAAIGLGPAGTLSGSIGATRGGGTQLALGYERMARPFAIAVHYLRQSNKWYDIAADHGAVTRGHLLSATAGLDLGRFGNLGITAIDQGRGRIVRPEDRRQRGAALPGLPGSTLATVTYSVRVAQRLNLVANAGGDRRRHRSGYLSLGALVVFGPRSSGYAGVLTHGGGTSVDASVSRPALTAGDVGYRLGAARGGIDRVAADLSYLGNAGYYAAQVERTNGVSAARVSARGALIVGRDGVLAADRQTGSFAVVDTDGEAGVTVYRDNRPIGTTDRRGKLVVADLRAYEATKISLDLLQLDDTVVVDRTDRWIKPASRAGVAVRFAMRRTTTAHVTLVAVDGRPIAPGARVAVNGGAERPVGLDGAVYVDDLLPANWAVVRLYGGGTCVAAFAAHPGSAPRQRIGPIACRAAGAPPAPASDAIARAGSSAAGYGSGRTRR